MDTRIDFLDGRVCFTLRILLDGESPFNPATEAVAAEAQMDSFSARQTAAAYSQLQVGVQGRTIMVEVRPTTAARELERLVATMSGMPRGSFRLYRGSKPLGSLEEYGHGSCIELKTLGRGGGCTGSKMESAGSEGASQGVSVDDVRLQKHEEVEAAAAAEKAAAENEAEGDGDEGGGDDKRGDEALEAAALAAGVPRHVFRAVVQVMGQLGRSGGLKKWVKHTAALLGVEKSELLREQVHEAGVRLLNAAEAPPPAAVATTQADKPSRTGKSSKAAAENEAKGELVRKRPCGVLSDPDDVGGRSGEVHTDGKPPGASAAPGKTASNSPTDDVQWRRVELGLTPRLIEASMTHLSRTISILFLPGQQTSTGGRLLGVIDSTETPLPHTDCGFDSGISSPSDHESEIKGLTVSGFLDFLSFSRCAACTRL